MADAARKKDMLDAMRKTVREIFDRQNLFDSIEEFYRRLHNEYRYVVIVPRKCLTEYKIFRKLWENEKIDDKASTFVTPKGLARLRDELLRELETYDKGNPRKFLAVVDDMMLYGRGINRFLTDFYDGLGEKKEKLLEQTYLEIFIESCNEMLFRDDFRAVLEKRYDVFFTYGHRGLLNAASDIFIDSFLATCTPNTSFVRSWFFQGEGDLVPDYLKLLKDSPFLWSCSPGEAERGKSYAGRYVRGWTNYVFCEKNQPLMVKNLTEFCCVRYYYSETLNRYAITPYVFMKALTCQEIDGILEKFKKLLKLPAEREKDGLWESGRSGWDFYILKYEYLTQLFSDFYGIYFFRQYMDGNSLWSDIFYDDGEILSFSYGEENVYSIPELEQRWKSWKKEEIRDLFETKISINDEWFREGQEDACEKEALEVFDETLFDMSDIPDETVLSGSEFVQEFIRRYFSASGDRDNEKAEKAVGLGDISEAERIYGISSGTFCQKLRNVGKTVRDAGLPAIYSSFLDCMDRGICALTMKHKGTHIASFLNAGEQAYRVLPDPYMLIMKYLSRIEETCINRLNFGQTEEKAGMFLEAALEAGGFSPTDRRNIQCLRRRMARQGKRWRDVYVPRNGLDKRLDEIYERIYCGIMQ